VTPVRQFHEAFGLPVHNQPFMPDITRVMLRARLIAEEAAEVDAEFGRIKQRIASDWYLSQGAAINVYADIARLAKELSDLRYVVEGAELEFGIPGETVYAEVHRSNMSKLGEDGKPVRRHDGKVLKGPNYREADTLRAIGIIEGTYL
jgi:predicted HAD superfamily Cof-like phosphohydrolase